jgi:hypothetical protein
MTNESGLNHMGFKTASAFLEYILNSEGEIMWMHFDEAQRIESEAKDEAYNKGWDDCKTEIKNKATEFINSVKKENDEQ